MSQEKIKAKSYARITLALDIIRKNIDGKYAGFHELGIIKHQIDLFDEITIGKSDKIIITCDKEDVPIGRSNICWKVIELIKDKFNIKKSVFIDIKKNIPAQGGLAGGSSNGATVLKLLNSFWDLGLSTEELMNLGREVGMDIPYFFLGGTVFDSESGGEIRKIDTNVKLNFVVVFPNFGIDTGEAYRQIDYNKVAQQKKLTRAMEKFFVLEKLEEIGCLMHNDFELTIFQQKPELKIIKQKMLKAGCTSVVMSGSGSSMIGLVENKAKVNAVCQKLWKFKAVKVESF